MFGCFFPALLGYGIAAGAFVGLATATIGHHLQAARPRGTAVGAVIAAIIGFLPWGAVAVGALVNLGNHDTVFFLGMALVGGFVAALTGAIGATVAASMLWMWHLREDERNAEAVE